MSVVKTHRDGGDKINGIFGKMRNPHPTKQEVTQATDSPNSIIEMLVIGPSWGPPLGLFVHLRVNQGLMTDKV